jgi:uncharacterized delta-60 repeat protein
VSRVRSSIDASEDSGLKVRVGAQASDRQSDTDGQHQPQVSGPAGELDTSFDPGLGPMVNGTVNAVAIQGDGKILIGGSFSTYNGVICNGIARINTNGSLDTSFTSGMETYGVVNAIALQSDGKAVLGGAFTTYSGVSRNRIVRVNGDGSLDSSFNPGAGASNRVLALAIQTGGKILLGGEFATYDGNSRNRFTRINADGSFDGSFNPGGFGVTNTVRAITLQSDGKIVIGGSFATYNMNTRLRIARLNADGSLDPAFGSGGLGANNNDVNAVIVQSDGKVVIGGSFTSVGGSRNRIARLNTDGTTDASFNPGSGFNSPVMTLALQSDGKIIVGGNFASYNTVSRNGIVRVNTNGALDLTFDSGTGTTGGPGGGDAFSTVNAAALQSDGKVFIGGIFTKYNGVSRVGVARINTDGSLENTFSPGNGPGVGGSVFAIAIQGDGRVLLGGDFSTYNNIGREGVARVNSDGSLDISFNPGTGADQNVSALAVQSDGKILLGGFFTSYNGVSRDGLARVNSDGSLDLLFNPALGLGAAAFVIVVQSDGKIIVAGNIPNGIVRLNIDGSSDASFDPGTGVSNVSDVIIQSNGKILLGGSFQTYNGVSRNRLARINSNGSLDTTFDPGTGADSFIDTVSMHSDGKIFFGGGFTNYNGAGRVRVARANSDGGLDMSFDPGTGANNSVFSSAIQNDGKILVGGGYTTFNGSNQRGILRLNSNGLLDSVFNSVTGTGPADSFRVESIVLQSNGRILLGGSFHDYNGVSRNGIARIFSGLPEIQFSASSYPVTEGTDGVSVTVNRTGDTTAASTVDYATSDSSGANNCNVVSGAASSRCDYLITLGTLHFAANETSKTILLPITNDSWAEGSENFTITLTNPTGGVVAAPSIATITITDNETVNGINPLDTTAFFVRQHYLDFLNREPDTDGFNFWVNQIDSCGADTQCIEVRRIHVSASFFLSIEFQDTGYLVERLYKVSYGDATGNSTIGPPHTLPVPIVRFNEFLTDTQKLAKGVIVGQPGWETVLETNKQTLVAEFVQRTRFATAHPTVMTPTDFVSRLFINAAVLPTFAERQAAINEFGVGAVNTADLAARGRALRRVAEHPTLAMNEVNRAFVLMQYFGYLRRNPNDPQDSDHSGYDFWLTKLNLFNGNFISAEMVKGFITSIEYRQRFGP